MRVVWVAAVMVTTAFMATGSMASAEAEPETMTLFLTSDRITLSGVTATCDTLIYGISEEEPPGAGKAYKTRSYGGLGCRTNFEYQVTEPLQLVGDAAVSIWLACDLPAAGVSPAAQDVRFILQRNTQSISGDVNRATGRTVCDSTPVNLQAPLGTANTAFGPGDRIRLSVIFFAATTGPNERENAHILVGGERAATLKVTALFPERAAAGPLVEVVEAEDFEVDLGFEEPTTTDLEYQWNTTRTEVRLVYESNLSEGQANLTVVDGGNQTVFQTLLSGNATDERVAANATAGTWRVLVALEDAVGNLTVRIDTPAPVAVTDGPRPADGNETSYTSGPAEGNATGDAAASIPAAPVGAALGAVLVGAALARRRRGGGAAAAIPTAASP